MKVKNVLGGLLLVTLSLTACSKEKHAEAQRNVDEFTDYADSLLATGEEASKANWDEVEMRYNEALAKAESSVPEVKEKDRAAAQEKIATAKSNFATLKANVIKLNEASMTNSNQSLRDSFFGVGVLKSDTDFSWVNKDNILKAYEDFYTIYDKNADTYSREQLDQIKLIYEALDAHKNKVEKEGLRAEDNRKIAELKVKFAPRFKWDRVVSKSEENADNKK